MKYNVIFQHGILKIKSADTDETMLKFVWRDAKTITIETKDVTSRHTRRVFDATFIHYHAMLELHDFIELDEFFNGNVSKFLNFGTKVVTSFTPEVNAVKHKLRKHIDNNDPDKVALYLTEAFSTDDPNAEFASHWKANLPPIKAVFEEQDSVFQEAAEFLKSNGWRVATINTDDHGYQLWCLKDGEGYHSNYDWRQDE